MEYELMRLQNDNENDETSSDESSSDGKDDHEEVALLKKEV
jgi:hypothetical protein